MPKAPSPQLLDHLRALVGPQGFIDDPDVQRPFLEEWRGKYTGKTPLVLKPATTDEVAAVVSACAAGDVAMVPQGGNTGLVGGQIPFEHGNEILISLSRLNRVRAIDPANNTMTVEAGVTLQAAQAAAAEADRLFPLSLAAEGSCQIGGNLSTNAGGVHVVRYGNTRDLVLGLEVVTADGRIWDGLRGLRKDNTGYDLKHLFIGAEGTLGIITAAVLKLFPRPRQVQTMFVGLVSAAAAVQLLELARSRCGDAVLAFELLPRIGMDFLKRHIAGVQDPLSAPSPWYVLTDVAVDRAAAEALLAEAARLDLVQDGTLAEAGPAAEKLWHLRESMPLAQRPEGASLKHDVAVPISMIPTFVDRALPLLAGLLPNARPVPFGHVGDGNLHFNITQPIGADPKAFMARGPEVHRAMHDLVAELGGSISAEHGIGRAKREEIARYKSPIEIELMARIKAALDPRGLMNPGKGVV